MNRYVKLVIAVVAMAAYLLALRYIAPSDEPYFIMGIGIVGLVAWLLGIVQGLVTILLLIPLTNYVYNQFPVSISYLSLSTSPAYLMIQIIAAISIGYLRHEKKILSHKATDLENVNNRLRKTLSQVQEIGGLHNLCVECKKIQDTKGVWKPIDIYLKEQTKIEFSHSICPDCAEHFHDQTPQNPKNQPSPPTCAVCCGQDDR